MRIFLFRVILALSHSFIPFSFPSTSPCLRPLYLFLSRTSFPTFSFLNLNAFDKVLVEKDLESRSGPRFESMTKFRVLVERSRRAVLFFGWYDAPKRHIEKYATMYNQRGYSFVAVAVFLNYLLLLPFSSLRFLSPSFSFFPPTPSFFVFPSNLDQKV